MIDFELPTEYISLQYLHKKRGDIGIAEDVCTVWNELHVGDYVCVKSVDHQYGEIVLTGTCYDKEELCLIVRQLASTCICIRYEHTILSFEI